ncbi:Transcriptional regulator, MarR family [Candidatus Desulfarcum epimagneticum]|uniref:Transcriptional regulator, MarR family n=1 Tax=uncultured Desulfobacteraceae bacterium TaxID=218296 RepID=A0A484HIZ3_9BACT|nr:Transcriptional regulator, MarR family [uncultured Desulfobacteraceae bacterium]
MKTDQILSNDVLIALRKIIQAIDLHSRELVRRYGLTGPQLVVLQEIFNNHTLSVGNLSRAVSLKHATVTGILKRLEKQGYILRKKDITDKRCVNVYITEKGKKIIESAPTPLQEHFVENYNKLKSWEKHMVLSSLQRIVEMMEARSIDASPFLATGPIKISK